MKILFQYYPFDMKISNNIFFGPILMELCYLFMNAEFRLFLCNIRFLKKAFSDQDILSTELKKKYCIGKINLLENSKIDYRRKSQRENHYNY